MESEETSSVEVSSTPKATEASPPVNKYKLTPSAQAQAYAESRRISYDTFEKSFQPKPQSRDIGELSFVLSMILFYRYIVLLLLIL